jgi:hypothetical protein
MDDQSQRELARELLEDLDDVVEQADEREQLREDITAALRLERPERDRQLTDVLRGHVQTRAWMAEREPDVELDRLVQPAGDPEHVGTYFMCPHGDSDFVRERVGDDVPLCPKHKIPLVPAPE